CTHFLSTQKDDLDKALNYIDHQNEFGNYDCLFVFIMPHGLIHSFFIAGSKEVVIRDIVKRHTDLSPITIWNGKPRLFFVQACRSEWPKYLRCNKCEGVIKNDLSLKMLVAYSCSASEASK
ncbi:unnamed protein product, partial [Rotaria sp. Silwood2]